MKHEELELKVTELMGRVEFILKEIRVIKMNLGPLELVCSSCGQDFIRALGFYEPGEDRWFCEECTELE